MMLRTSRRRQRRSLRRGHTLKKVMKKDVTPPEFYEPATVNGTVACVLSHQIANVPPVVVTSTKPIDS